jgi:hypothetical protein
MSRLIGVLASPNMFESNEFSPINSLRHEAQDVAVAFESYWHPTGETNLTILTGKVTHQELVYHLRKTESEAKPNDIYLFYYSGHGFTRQSTSFLALTNSRLNSADATCISLPEILTLLASVPKKLILIDACKAGGTSWNGFSLGTLSSLPAINEFAFNRSTALISAASAYEDASVGMFTNSLIDGIKYFARSVGKVDISVYFEYVRNDVSTKSEGKQNPSISFSGASLSLEFSVTSPNNESSVFNAADLQRRNSGIGITRMKKIKVLAIFANPKGSIPLRLEHEDRVMRESIKLSPYREYLDFEILHAVRVDDFARALLEKDYQIVHFSGHGTGKGLAFENEIQQVQVVPKDALGETISAYSPPIECVLLNACYSDVHAENLSMGVPYTIVMNGPISDDGATEFTRGFYDAIGAGKTIEFAYNEGCRRIKLKGLPDGATPVLIKKSAG